MKDIIKPIRPQDVVNLKFGQLPSEVIVAFNELILKNWNGSSSSIMQSDIVTLIKAKFEATGITITSCEIFDNHYLDVEPFYREQGWSVEYTKPCAYAGETFSPFFVFSWDTKN